MAMAFDSAKQQKRYLIVVVCHHGMECDLLSHSSIYQMFSTEFSYRLATGLPLPLQFEMEIVY